MKKILVIDGNSIINRAFYGVHTLTTHAGKPTNAIYGMISIISRQMSALKPDYAAVAFDLHAPTFRHKMYPEYKTGRRPTPSDLIEQFPDAKECLRAMGLHTLELEGYEADDIQGTVATMAKELPDGHTYILTGDRDLFQLIDDVTTVVYVGKETLEINREAFGEKYPGVTPEQFVDLKALMGDTSDHIPGVAGIGEKTAITLISEFKSLDGVYENLDSPLITKGVREKLIRSKENAYLSQNLATIFRDVPLSVTLTDLTYNGKNNDALYNKFTELELTSFISRFRLVPPSAAPTSSSFPESGKSTEGEEQADGSEGPAQTIEVHPSPKYLQGTINDIDLMNDKFAFHQCEGEIYLSDGNVHLCLSCPLSELAQLFTEEKTVICFDGKKLWHALYAIGIHPTCTFADVALYAYLLNSSVGVSKFPNLCSAFLGIVPADNSPSAHLLYELESVLYKKIDEINCASLLTNVELPLLSVLAEMEEAGFRIDREGINAYGAGLRAAADTCLATIEQMAGHSFNVNSPKQLGEVLFEELCLPVSKKKKNGYSTDAETLEKLRPAHPIIEEILLYRQLTKLYNTYALGLVAAADKDDRIHTDFKQTLTSTGRLSSAEPNLQNIPIRTPLGRELRRYFVPATGKVLVDADYSQIELRLLAVLSGDEAMIRAFREGIDIHIATAASAFRVPLSDVTPELRKRAKAINFGIVYGISAFSLAQDLHISVSDARSYINAYMETYPSISTYLDDVVRQATDVGYTETLYGRRRYIPELRSANGMMRALGRRLAMNAPIQGTAADIMKMAMVRVWRALKEELPTARLMMQVHDELVVECDEADATQVADILKREMEGVADFTVPLTVEVTSGYNWLK